MGLQTFFPQQLVLNKDQFAKVLINSNYKAHCSFSEDFRLENDT